MPTLSNAALEVIPRSRANGGGAEWGLARTDRGARLVVQAPSTATYVLDELEGDVVAHGTGHLLVGALTARNATALRRHLPWLAPRPLGLTTSAGMGDRLGLATPGHVRAMRAAGGAIAPIFAQQSIREMSRTGRTPEQVLDAATWGAFEEGWQSGLGADADHLKTTADIDRCLAAGFSLFTIDPGEHVDGAADTADEATLRPAFDALPWAALEDSAEDLRRRYEGHTFYAEGYAIEFSPAILARAAVKYGRAVAHVVAMYRHLASRAAAGTFELEVSVDETDTPTSPAEHVYVAAELARLGVSWVSLAPRYVGRFEKGVDYIGDLTELEADLAIHATIARHWGPYKISLHSGSDKFSVYPLAVRQTRGLIHLKTAGTSYLEALRTVALIDPSLFREIYGFARERYDADRASYHVSATLDRAPTPAGLSDTDLCSLLEQFDAREILHVTFGSVLTSTHGDGRPRFADRLCDALRSHPDAYAANLEAHFIRHLRPFAEHAHRA